MVARFGRDTDPGLGEPVARAPMHEHGTSKQSHEPEWPVSCQQGSPNHDPVQPNHQIAFPSVQVQVIICYRTLF